METKILLVLILSLFVLLALLFPFISNAGSTMTKAVVDANCYGSIVTMYNYQDPLTQGTGITCKTEKLVFGGGEPVLEQQLANEMVRCSNQFGNFRMHPFYTSHLDTICLMCSRITFKTDVKGLQNVDLYLLRNQYKDTSYFEFFTGRPPIGLQTQAFIKTPDKIATDNEYAVVWVYANTLTLDDFLKDIKTEKKQDVLLAGMLFLIPGVTVNAPYLSSTALGFGSGMFLGTPEQYHDQAIFLMPMEAAQAIGCKELDGSPYVPIA